MVKIRKTLSRRKSGKTFEYLILILPGVFLLFIIQYLPLNGLVLAFKDFRYDVGLWGSKWIGFKNFKFLFESITAFRIIRNTLLLNSLFIVTSIVGSLIIALLLYQINNRSLIKVFQTSMFLPYFLSWPVTAFITFAFLNADLGLLNRIIIFFGFKSILWYNDPAYWPWLLTIINFWKVVGYNVIIFYAAMMAIGKSLFEAAKIDGANSFTINRKIILPPIAPVIVMMIFLKLGRIFFADFGLFFMVTRDSGLLYPTTDVIDTFILRTIRVTGDIGIGTAVGLYQSVCGLIVVLLSNFAIKKLSSGNEIL